MEAEAREAEERILLSLSKDEALKNAIAATEMYMKAIKLARKACDKERLKARCMKVLATAEEIKQAGMLNLPLHDRSQVETSYKLAAPLSCRAFPVCEQIILLESSKLHGFVFSPWTAEPEEELFQGIGYNDRDSSELKLSKSQQKHFAGWRRPYEAFRDRTVTVDMPETYIEPNMAATDNTDLIQDVTADCSVVASLCAAMAQPGRGFENLLRTIFYPYDKEKNRPMISETGLYIFRLYFNGCFRKVVIDDRLPYSNSTRTLHVVDRQNPSLLWPALLEKAYLKMQGGYDFPGSNSGTDLWVLTGWIPEQIFLQSDEVDPQRLWSRTFNSYGFGDVILSLGTGRLNRLEEEGLGLAGEHDYAVLDMKESDGQQLILVKNPWCDGMTWRGTNTTAYSKERSAGFWANADVARQTEKLESPPSTFWIAFNQVLCNFESMYLNWNPALFRFRQDLHFSWKIQNSVSTNYFTHNPQYSLCSVKGGSVWVLLSRHFRTEERNVPSASNEERESQDFTKSPLGFIGIYVCGANGKRVHLSNTILRGPLVDSPQTLIRLEMPAVTRYTLVIVQQDLPLPKYSFTLSVYSRDPVSIDNALDIYPHHRSLPGAWTMRTGGGNAGSSSYTSNPQFRLSVTSTTNLVLLLETNQPELPVHLKMVWGGGDRVTIITTRDILGESGEYRRGFATAEMSSVLAGTYTIICSTFEEGQTGTFILRVESTVPCEIKPIAGEAAGRLSFQLPRVFMCGGVDRMLAPVVVSRLTNVKTIARHCGTPSPSHIRAKAPLKVSLERGQGPNKIILASSCDGEFNDAPAGVRTRSVDVAPQKGGQEALWLVVERFGGSHLADEVEVEVFSEALIEVGIWGTGDG